VLYNSRPKTPNNRFVKERFNLILSVFIEDTSEKLDTFFPKFFIDYIHFIIFLLFSSCINWLAKCRLQQECRNPYLFFDKTIVFLFLFALFGGNFFHEKFFSCSIPFFVLVRFFVPFVPHRLVHGTPLVEPLAKRFSRTP